MRAMLLCAGAGLRMRPLTLKKPKVLLEVQGQALLERHLHALADAGIREIVINLGHLGEQIRTRFGSGVALGLSISYLPEDPILETGGGVAQALPLLGTEPFMVISADILTDFDFGTLPTHLDPETLLHLVLVDNPTHHPRGDYALVEGRLRRTGSQRLNFAGIGIYDPVLFEGCPRGAFALNVLFNKAIARGVASGAHYRGYWHNVGTPQQLVALNAAPLPERIT